MLRCTGAATDQGAFSRRVSAGGGGLHNFQGTTTITGSTFKENSAGGDGVGGGIMNGGGGGAILDITDTKFESNSARHGAGVYSDGVLTVSDSTFTANAASDTGGGLLNIQGTATITESTFSGNSAGVQGGGIVNIGTTPVSNNNTIVAGNTAPVAPDVSGDFTSLGYNLIGIADGSTGFGSTGDLLGSGASPLDPKLGGLANNGGRTKTMKLRGGSPAPNAGDPSLAGTTDQRGVLRPQGGGVDIGAYERE